MSVRAPKEKGGGAEGFSWEPGTGRLGRGPKGDAGGVLGAGSRGCWRGFRRRVSGMLASARAVKQRSRSESGEGEPAARPRCGQPARPQAARNSGSRIAQLPLRRPSRSRTRFRCKSPPQRPRDGVCRSLQSRLGFVVLSHSASDSVGESGYLPLVPAASRQTLRPVCMRRGSLLHLPAPWERAGTRAPSERQQRALCTFAKFPRGAEPAWGRTRALTVDSLSSAVEGNERQK